MIPGELRTELAGPNLLTTLCYSKIYVKYAIYSSMRLRETWIEIGLVSLTAYCCIIRPD